MAKLLKYRTIISNSLLHLLTENSDSTVNIYEVTQDICRGDFHPVSTQPRAGPRQPTPTPRPAPLQSCQHIRDGRHTRLSRRYDTIWYHPPRHIARARTFFSSIHDSRDTSHPLYCKKYCTVSYHEPDETAHHTSDAGRPVPPALRHDKHNNQLFRGQIGQRYNITRRTGQGAKPTPTNVAMIRLLSSHRNKAGQRRRV